MLLKFLRNALGYLIIIISFLIPIRKIVRSADEQKCINKKTAAITLYQFYACPFCLKTRRAIKRLGLKIETRDALKKPARTELRNGGGEIKVPCLRIEINNKITWMYESNDIIKFLEHHFDEDSLPCNELSL